MPVSHRPFPAVRTILAAALAFAALPAAAQTYTQTVFFGDSLTDSGWFRPALVQVGGPAAYAVGRFSTNPGLVWADYLAQYYGGNGMSANQGGDNHAVGGARAVVDGTSSFGVIPSVSRQVDNYLAANGGRADSRALYSVWVGANDLRTGDAAAIGAALNGTVGIVGRLQGAGARYIVVPTIPDLSLTVEARNATAALPPATRDAILASLSASTATYNSTLFGGFAASGLRVIPVDTFHFLREVVAAPAAYGLANVDATACAPAPAPAGAAITCSLNNLVDPSAASTYLFADAIHPTSAGHAMLAQLALNMLEAPRQIEVLALSESQVGRGRAERVSAHLATRPEGDGMRWWADVRGDNQRFGNPVHYDGGGPTLTLGVDWTSGNLVYGGFAGYGVQRIDFGLRRGEFKQRDGSLGGFAGWHGDALWASGQLSWTRTSYDVDRDVHLGPATRRHSGSPDGDNLSAGIDAGWDFRHGALTHGPVVSLLMQRIKVDGYAEDSTESTALAYPDQDFDSLIGSAGWQASYAIRDGVVPYARLTWDHEFEDAPEEAFAQSRSLPGTLPYAVPGLELDDSYGTLQVGVRTRVFGLDANVGASATLGQEVGDHATVFVTVGNRF